MSGTTQLIPSAVAICMMCIVMMIFLTPPCLICSCCAFITKSIWMPTTDDD